MIQAIFEKTDGTERMTGYATVSYSSSDEGETVVETTQDELASVFQTAADAGVDELAGAGEPIEAAIEEPLRYYDYMILESEEIIFDTEYTRKNE